MLLDFASLPGAEQFNCMVRLKIHEVAKLETLLLSDGPFLGYRF